MSSNFSQWYADGRAGVVGSLEPKGQNRAKLGGIVLAGHARVVSGSPSLKIDPRKKKGANAAHPTTHGMDVIEFALQVTCWTTSQRDLVDAAIAQLCPPANLLPVPFEHEQLSSIVRVMGPIDVIVVNLPLWTPSAVVRPGWDVMFKLLHWPASQRDAKGKSTTPDRPKNVITGNSGGASGNPAPTSSSTVCGPPASFSS